MGNKDTRGQVLKTVSITNVDLHQTDTAGAYVVMHKDTILTDHPQRHKITKSSKVENTGDPSTDEHRQLVPRVLAAELIIVFKCHFW